MWSPGPAIRFQQPIPRKHLSHALRILKQNLEAQKSQGSTAVSVDYLLTAIGELEQVPEPEPTPAQLAHYTAKLQDILERAKHGMTWEIETFKAVIAAGQSAIRTSVTINGGASVAILAYLGHLAEHLPAQVPEFAGCLLPFGAGTLLAGCVSALTYCAQYAYAGNHAWHRTAGYAFNVSAILFGLASFLSFGLGIWNTYSAFVP